MYLSWKEEKMSVFEKLSVINVNDKKSKKNNLDYLSWAFAWSEVKKVYPEANSNFFNWDRLVTIVHNR